jgi:hypothetical protein
MCTALFVLSLVRFQQNGWRENIVAFLIGLLSGYYYTSAWYVGRTRESGGAERCHHPNNYESAGIQKFLGRPHI